MPENWPIPGLADPPFRASSYENALSQINEHDAVFELVNSTNAERNSVAGTRCDLGHNISIVVLRDIRDGKRYIFGQCNTPHNPGSGERSRAIFFPWFPFYMNEW